MNAAILLLASFLTFGAVEQPLHIVEWRAHVLVGDQDLPIEAGPNGVVVPLPPAMTKEGWLCVIAKRDHAANAQLQSIVCKVGHGDGPEFSFGATAICVTNHEDVDVQRVTVGNMKEAVGITLSCHSSRAVGASI